MMESPRTRPGEHEAAPPGQESAETTPALDEDPILRTEAFKLPVRRKTFDDVSVDGGETGAVFKGETRVQGDATAKESRLMSLPPELTERIVENLTDRRHKKVLGMTCKAFYLLILPQLHRRIFLSVLRQDQITQFIRTLEPHLTIAQKKQLRKEAKYPGQQDSYPAGCDEQSIPLCASYVRELVVGPLYPDIGHEFKLHRYVEEVLKNLTNLVILKTPVLKRWKWVAKSLEAIKSLEALHLITLCAGDEGFPALQLKHLKHLRCEQERCRGGSADGQESWQDNVQSILRGSASGLESLNIQAHDLKTLVAWGSGRSISELTSGGYLLPAVKALSVTCCLLDAKDLNALLMTVDFENLTQLSLGIMGENTAQFHRKLAGLATSSSADGLGFKLRRLCIWMGNKAYVNTTAACKESYDAIIHFLTSFITLESLEVTNYAPYDDEVYAEPGIPGAMLHAILGHKNLRTLRFSYKIPSARFSHLGVHISAEIVKTILENLPWLQEFRFPLDEASVKEIAQALTRGTRLTFIECNPRVVPFDQPTKEACLEPVFIIAKAFLEAFRSRHPYQGEEYQYHDDQLQRENCQNSAGSFVWEEYCKLRMIYASYNTWELASEFSGRFVEGSSKPKRVSSEDGQAYLLYRESKGNIPKELDNDGEWPGSLGGDLNS